MAAPTLGNQLISYLSVDWVPPALDGGAAIVNYVVLRAPTAEGDYTVAATLVSSASSFGIAELGASTQVCFRLMAENNGGRSNASEPGCFETLPAALPLAPSLFPTASSADSLSLSWLPANGSGLPIASYDLQSCDEAVSGEDCANDVDGAFDTVYTDLPTAHTQAGLGPDARIWWRIASVTALGSSDYSEPLQLRTDAAGATSPAQPEPPGVAAVGSDSAAVAWPAVGDGADGGAQILEYVLTLETLMDDDADAEVVQRRRRPGGGGGAMIDGYRGFALGYGAQNLPASTAFCVELAAANNQGTSSLSTRICNSTTAAPPPTAPEGLWVVNTSAVGVLVGWSGAAGNGLPVTAYQLQMDDCAQTPSSLPCANLVWVC